MAELTLTFWIVALAMVFATGVSKAGFGAGIEALAVPVLALFLVPQFAAAVMLPILLVIDAVNLWRWRKEWDRRVLARVLPAAVVGIGVGALLFNVTTPDVLRLIVGLLALAFLAQRILLPLEALADAPPPPPAITVALAGVAGITSTLAHAGGPPAKIALLRERLAKNAFVATNAYWFAAMNLMKLPAYLALAQISAQSLTLTAKLALVVPFGVVAGYWLNGRISERAFNHVILVALGLAGSKLVYDGASALL